MSGEIETWTDGRIVKYPDKQASVLIIDSSVTARELVANMFLDAGMEAITSGDSADALKKFSVYNFDVVIMEFFSVSINAFQLVNTIRGLSCDSASSILIYAWCIPQNADSLRQMGDLKINGFMSKPIDAKMIDKLMLTHEFGRLKG